MKQWVFNAANVAKTDLLQKVRKKSTLAIIVFFMLFTIFCFPDRASQNSFSISLGNKDIQAARGVYNSDWIGVLIIVYFGIVLLFAGIHLIRKTVRREQMDGYGMLMASSNVSKSAFFEGKRLSNFLYLSGLMFVVEILGIIIQFVRNEAATLNLFAYLIPYLVIILPFVYLLATIAVLFEVVPGLRSSLGSFFVFVLAMIVMMSSIVAAESNGNVSIFGSIIDFSGLGYCMSQVRSSFLTTFGAKVTGFTIFGDSSPYSDFFTFHFNWSNTFIVSRVIIVIFAFLLLYLIQSLTSLKDIFLPRAKHTGLQTAVEEDVQEVYTMQASQSHYFTQPMEKAAVRNISFLRLVYYQALPIIREHSISCLLVAGLFIAQWLPLQSSLVQRLMIVSTILPIFIWSKIGAQKEMGYLKTTIAFPRSIIASNLFGSWGIWLIYFSGTIFKSLLSGNLVGTGIVIISAFLIPTFAYASNSFTKSGLFFEFIYIFLWYIEVVQKAHFINLFNQHSHSIMSLMGLMAALIVCTIIAVINRNRLTSE